MRALIASVLAGIIVGILAVGSGAETRLGVGTGEKLLVVIAGEYEDRDDAVAAGDQMSFGDIQGFYVAASDDFDGEEPGRWLLVSAFRTQAGAASFEEIAHLVGVNDLRRALTTYRGSDPIGLGQESDPSGTGPLLTPLPLEHLARL